MFFIGSNVEIVMLLPFLIPGFGFIQYFSRNNIIKISNKSKLYHRFHTKVSVLVTIFLYQL